MAAMQASTSSHATRRSRFLRLSDWSFVVSMRLVASCEFLVLSYEIDRSGPDMKNYSTGGVEGAQRANTRATNGDARLCGPFLVGRSAYAHTADCENLPLRDPHRSAGAKVPSG